MRTKALLCSVSIVAFGAAAIFGCSAEADPVPSGTGGSTQGTGGAGPGTGGGTNPGVGGGTNPGTGGGTNPGTGGGTNPGTGGGQATGGAGPGTGGGGGDIIDCADSPASGGEPLIDDVEDGDNAIVPPRTGWWFTYNDQSGTQAPEQGETVEPEADGENTAVHTTGSGFAVWGAGVGVSPRGGTDMTCPYDASTFSGVSFRIKGTSTGTTPNTVRFSIGTPGTTLAGASNGGTCEPETSGTMTVGCDDHYGVEIPISADWMDVEVRWNDPELQQGGWGVAATFDPSAILQLQWQVSGTETDPAEFDFWVDDVAFLP